MSWPPAPARRARTLGIRFVEPPRQWLNTEVLDSPRAQPAGVELVKGPNLASPPGVAPFRAGIADRGLHKVGDDISTDGILHAGSRVLSLRSTTPDRFAFETVDPSYDDRVLEVRDAGVLVVMAGDVDTGRARAVSPPP
ncbi:MAG: hypothetical protein ACREN1_09120 [Candidatus Dormibacteria bacterium]